LRYFVTSWRINTVCFLRYLRSLFVYLRSLFVCCTIAPPIDTIQFSMNNSHWNTAVSQTPPFVFVGERVRAGCFAPLAAIMDSIGFYSTKGNKKVTLCRQKLFGSHDVYLFVIFQWRRLTPRSACSVSFVVLIQEWEGSSISSIYIRVPIYKGWTKKWLSLGESSTHIILEGTLLSSTAASLLQKQETEKSTQIELFDAPRSTCIKEQLSYIPLQPNCWNFQDEMLTYLYQHYTL
jgi:hypothetical protein